MANIRKISENSYKITVSCGRDAANKQIRHYMTWRPDRPMTEKQMEKAVQKAAYEFEKQIGLGFRMDDNRTFEEYAAYFLDLKRRDGTAPTTIDSYKFLLHRINSEFGQMRLKDIRPYDLNRFYAKLEQPGTSTGRAKCVPLVDVLTLISRNTMHTKCGIPYRTINAVCGGGEISEYYGQKICETINAEFDRTFRITTRNEYLSKKTIAHYHGLMYTILGQAEREMIVTYNAAAKATPPKVGWKEKRSLQPDEITRVLDAAQGDTIRTQAIIYTLLCTGCRCGELCALKWSKIDFDNKLILVDANISSSSEKGLMEGKTKNRLFRYVSMPDILVSVLRKYRSWYTQERFRLCGAWVDNDYVFCRPLGAALAPCQINGILQRFCEDHGISRITPHEFRHTYASLMIASGVDVVTVSRMLGHSSTKITLDVYSHQIDEAKNKAANVLNNVIKTCKTG
jgi:integrase